MAHVGNSSRFIISQTIDDDGSAIRAIAFVTQLDVFHAFQFTGAFFNGAVDVVSRHVDAFGAINSQTQTRVKANVTATHFGGHGNFFGQTREDAPTFFILTTFTVLDVGPFTMTRQNISPSSWL